MGVAPAEGVEFPESEDTLRARLSGLLGDGRWRNMPLEGWGAVLLDFAERRESFTLWRKGVEKENAWGGACAAEEGVEGGRGFGCDSERARSGAALEAVAAARFGVEEVAVV